MEIHYLTCFLEFLSLYFFNTKVTDADLENEIGRATENIKETEIQINEEQQNSEITSEGDWYWDDKVGWVQDLPKETKPLLQNKQLVTKQEEEKKRQQLFSIEKEKIEKLEKEVLVRIELAKQEEAERLIKSDKKEQSSETEIKQWENIQLQ